MLQSNLIGEHTDDNDGFTLPMALPFDTAVAMSDHGDETSGTVEIVSVGFGDVVMDPAADPRSDTPAAWIAGRSPSPRHRRDRDTDPHPGGVKLRVR